MQPVDHPAYIPILLDDRDPEQARQLSDLMSDSSVAVVDHIDDLLSINEVHFKVHSAEDVLGKAAELRYVDGVVAGDVDGDRAADFLIEIANDHPLRASDFIL